VFTSVGSNFVLKLFVGVCIFPLSPRLGAYSVCGWRVAAVGDWMGDKNAWPQKLCRILRNVTTVHIRVDSGAIKE
jgi:hypothetical protein